MHGFFSTPLVFAVTLSVLVLFGECDTKLSRDHDKPTIVRSVKDAAKVVGHTVTSVGSSAWRSTKDKAKSLMSGVFGGSPLGPEQNEQSHSKVLEEVCNELTTEQDSCSAKDYEEGSCSAEGCRKEESYSADSFKEDGSCSAEGCEALKGTEFELSEVREEDESVFSQITGLFKSGMTTVYRTAKENIVDGAAEMVRNFSEAVREIVHEELYAFLASICSSLQKSLLSPGTTLYNLGQTTMSIVLVILCVLLSYLFLFRVSIFVILGVDAAVYLLHKVMGPKWIFKWIFEGIYQFVWLLRLTYSYPYLAAVGFVILFLYFIVFPLARRCTERTPAQRAQDLERIVLDLSERLGQLEQQQRERLRVLEQQQTEMLNILKRLDGKHKAGNG